MAILKIKQIKDILHENNLKPLHRFGQNFLISDDVLSDIVAAAQLTKDDTVVEVGAGLAVLTEELVAHAGSVLTVEIDKGLLTYVHKKFDSVENIEIFGGDVMSSEFYHFFQQWLTDKKLKALEYKVVANIPYNITSALIKFFLTQVPRPEQLVLLMQKEVARRITATAGNLSLLAISVQYFGKPMIVREVKAGSFFPPPEVESAVLSIDCRQPGIHEPKEYTDDFFFKIVRAGFKAKRKKMYNNLSTLGYSKDEIMAVFESCGLEINIRAQHLSMSDWHVLVSHLWEKNKQN